jgi:shikimate kinase
MRIFLIGPMASGKTTIGQKLAKHLQIGFIDTDQQIEKNTGAEISWIFDIEGEKSFREREHQILKKACSEINCVISTGGGIVIRKDNRDLLRDSGLIIYLETSIQSQLERTLLDKSRPLLDSKDKELTLRNLKKERSPLYEEIANITIKEKERGHNVIFQDILNKIKEIQKDNA